VNEDGGREARVKKGEARYKNQESGKKTVLLG
jgi:hypothetical protein